MANEETAALLARVQMFSELEAHELEQLSEVAVPRRWERGERVFQEGDSGDTCYVIRTGTVSVTRKHSDGRTIALAELRSGAMFGELAMFADDSIRSATVEALEPTSAVALLAPDVQRLLRERPEIGVKMLAQLAHRVRAANARIAQQSFQTVSGRVAGVLLSQVETRQAEGAPDGDVLIQATQAEIAQLAGSSRESASRFLATLERERVVTLGRGKVLVHEPAKLTNYIH